MSKYYLDYTEFSGTNRRKLDLGGKLALVGLSGLALGGALRGIPKLKEHYKVKKAYKDYVKSVEDSGDELLDKENFKNFKKAVEDLKYKPDTRGKYSLWIHPAPTHGHVHPDARFMRTIEDPYKRVLSASRSNDAADAHNKKAAEFNKWKDNLMRIGNIDHSKFTKNKY